MIILTGSTGGIGSEVLKELSIVIQDVASKNNISLVFSDNQYYLSSTSLDISDIIIQELNKKKIDFNIIK